MEALIFALGGGLVRSTSDRFHAECFHIGHQLASQPRRSGNRAAPVRKPHHRSAVAGVRHAPRCLRASRSRRLCWFLHQPRGRPLPPGVIIFQLEDDTFAATDQHVFCGIQLSTRVGCWVDEPAVGGTRLLRRLHSGDLLFAEDSCQRCYRRRIHAQPQHFIVDTDGPVIQPRRFQCGTPPSACCLISSVSLVGEVLDRREPRSNAAAWPSSRARARMA